MKALLKAVLEDLSYFHPNSEGITPIPYVWEKGEIPLCLVLGPNGGGKSFFRRLIRLMAQRKWKNTECLTLSMEGRTQEYGMVRAFVYGDEARSSTGELSGSVILTGIRTCQKRDQAHFIYWDEPDLGMGESESAGAGQVLAEFVTALPKLTRAVFVTSHSRGLVGELAALKPHYVHLGEDAETAPKTLSEWLSRPIRPIRPEVLQEASFARFRAIQAILNSVDKKRKG